MEQKRYNPISITIQSSVDENSVNPYLDSCISFKLNLTGTFWANYTFILFRLFMGIGFFGVGIFILFTKPDAILYTLASFVIGFIFLYLLWGEFLTYNRYIKNPNIRTITFDTYNKKMHTFHSALDFANISTLKLIEFISRGNEGSRQIYYGIFLSDSLGLLFNTYFSHKFEKMEEYAYYLQDKFEAILNCSLEFEYVSDQGYNNDIVIIS